MKIQLIQMAKEEHTHMVQESIITGFITVTTKVSNSNRHVFYKCSIWNLSSNYINKKLRSSGRGVQRLNSRYVPAIVNVLTHVLNIHAIYVIHFPSSIYTDFLIAFSSYTQTK